MYGISLDVNHHFTIDPASVAQLLGKPMLKVYQPPEIRYGKGPHSVEKTISYWCGRILQSTMYLGIPISSEEKFEDYIDPFFTRYPAEAHQAVRSLLVADPVKRASFLTLGECPFIRDAPQHLHGVPLQEI